MDKEAQQEELQEAFAAFAAEYPQSALALITGLFVGLLEYSVKEQGGDETLPIKIDGCGKRDITVSAKPHNPTPIQHTDTRAVPFLRKKT